MDAAGGQKRRLGRFLFAMSVHKFRDAMSDLVREMQRRGPHTTDCTFHVFCGLAGGTGSGAVLDVAAQIRRMYPNPALHKIILYCYLPDLNPPTGWDMPNYFPNAYAALLELNAISTGAWTPFDISGRHGQAPTAYEFAFNGCYLFSDKNAQGYAAAIDRDLLDVVADFVFHKTVLAHRTNWEQLSKAENAENGDSSPEKPAGSKAGLRSVRFLGFGISRVAFPEETIR